MFRIEAFVEDKKLGDVLKAMAGLTRGTPVVMPMINVEEQGDGPVKAAGNGNMVHLLGAYLRKSHRTRISAKEIGAWLKSQGRSPMSASYMAREAVKAHVLKKASNVKGGVNSGLYDVVNPAKSSKKKAGS